MNKARVIKTLKKAKQKYEKSEIGELAIYEYEGAYFRTESDLIDIRDFFPEEVMYKDGVVNRSKKVKITVIIEEV